MRRLDAEAPQHVYGLNLILLMFVAILPFSISLMVTRLESSDVRAAVVVYGLNVLLASLTLSVLLFYVAREPGIVVHGVADERLQAMHRRRWFIIGVNVFVIAIAFVEPRVAVALYLITTVLVLAMPLLGLGRKCHRRVTPA